MRGSFGLLTALALIVGGTLTAKEAKAGAITHTWSSGGTNSTFVREGSSWETGTRQGSQLDIYVPDGVNVDITGSGGLGDFNFNFAVGGQQDPAVNYSRFDSKYGSTEAFTEHGTSWSTFGTSGVRLDPVNP